MTKAGDKILTGVRQAHAVARGELDAIASIKVRNSCGCVFCDIGLEPFKIKGAFLHIGPATTERREWYARLCQVRNR